MEVKRDFTKDEIIQIVKELGQEPLKNSGDNILVYPTICHNHNGGSPKLYYYADTNLFHCYTECGESFDVYALIQRNKHCNFAEARAFVHRVLGISSIRPDGFFSSVVEELDDWEIFNRYKPMTNAISEIECSVYPNTILDLYHDIPPVQWQDEGIPIEVMKHYGIRYDLSGNHIIIPHYNMDGQLVGIRQRALSQDEIDSGHKYMPTRIEDKYYSHPLAFNLYGLDVNKEAIQRTGKAMIVEGEKSVLKCGAYYGENNFVVACCGSGVSRVQRNMLLKLGIKEVFIGLDKEYHKPFTPESDEYSEKVLRIAYQFAPYVTTYVLWDVDDLLEYKDAPCDKGKDVLEVLMKNKFEVKTKDEKLTKKR